MEIAIAVGGFFVGGVVGFATALFCRMAADEPDGIPRNEDVWSHTTSMPPRLRPVLMADPTDSSTWDSD